MLVLGDAMADWLGYGLEDAYSEQPDMGVIRKHKTVSGLIKYQPRGEPADWAAAAKGILATEKPDAIVVMLGLHDRVADPRGGHREEDRQEGRQEGRARQAGRSESLPDAKLMPKPADAKPKRRRRDRHRKAATTKPVDAELSPDDASRKRCAANHRSRKERALGRRALRVSRRALGRTLRQEDRRADRRAEIKGVPVLWVGLPAIRGQRGTSDMLFLDALYRDGAGKAGITYVDVWDGFVDEAGRFLQKGPTSKARSASCARPTASSSPRPARASSRIMSSAR